MYNKKNFKIEDLVERLLRETTNRTVVWETTAYTNSMEAKYIKKYTEKKNIKISIFYNYKYEYNTVISISFNSNNVILYYETFNIVDNENAKIPIKKLVRLILRMKEEDMMEED